MKTIYLTIFEGVEAKNLLRTSVLKNILRDREVRIVLFTKSDERVSYYRKEFNDERISYEVVAKPTIRGLDKFFSNLKFLLIQTATMDLRRHLAFTKHRNWFLYGGGFLMNRILAHAWIRRIIRSLDFHLVRDTTYRRHFETYKPDLVFLAHLFDEPEIHLLREAKRRRVQSVGFINSWDKVTARAAMRLLPDKAIVFNDIVKHEMMVHNDMDPKDILVSGLPQYDFYSTPDHASRETFGKRIGIDPSSKLIVYAPMGSAFSGSDWTMIDLLSDLNRAGRFGPK